MIKYLINLCRFIRKAHHVIDLLKRIIVEKVQVAQKISQKIKSDHLISLWDSFFVLAVVVSAIGLLWSQRRSRECVHNRVLHHRCLAGLREEKAQ